MCQMFMCLFRPLVMVCPVLKRDTQGPKTMIGLLPGKKKAHKHKFFYPVGLGTTPGLSRGFHRVCPWDKPGENLGTNPGFLLILHNGSPANPGLSLGQSQGRRAVQKVYVKKVYVAFSLAILEAPRVSKGLVFLGPARHRVSRALRIVFNWCLASRPLRPLLPDHWITNIARGFLGTGRPDPTLEYASPSPPQGSIRHRFDIDSASIRHRFPDLTLFRCRIDAKSTPEEGRARRIRGWGPGGLCLKSPSQHQQRRCSPFVGLARAP